MVCEYREITRQFGSLVKIEDTFRGQSIIFDKRRNSSLFKFLKMLHPLQATKLRACYCGKYRVLTLLYWLKK
jgi:hypothetical protein